MMRTDYRLGIDAGGTFTDFVIADRRSGKVKLFKALSTPSDPTKAKNFFFQSHKRIKR